MKKPTCAWLIAAIALLVTASVCRAETYEVTQLTNNAVEDHSPQINGDGVVVWAEHNGTDDEILLHDGFLTVPLQNMGYNDHAPQINDSGYVVWEGSDGSDSEIFIYDGSVTTQITDNAFHDYGCQINGNGVVVWAGNDGSDDEIFLYDGSVTTQITDNAFNDYGCQINENGVVVWAGSDGSDDEIFLYDGSGVTQLTNNAYEDTAPQINDQGRVVWQGYDGTDLEIFLYDGSGITPITANTTDDKNPQINNSGEIVWSGSDFVRYQIFLFNGTGITQLTNEGDDDLYPQINDNGVVVWIGSDGSDYEIFLYDGTETINLSDNDSDDIWPQINALGYVVWQSYDGPYDAPNNEIFYASPSCGANFAGVQLSGMAPLTVQFADLSSGDIETWAWDFDDDGWTDSTEQNPVHTYASEGVYTVTLTVSGRCGQDSLTRVAYVNVSACNADFFATPSTGMAPLAVTFSDLSVGDISAWSWDFDGDGTTDSQEQNPVYTFETGGTYTVSLTVDGLCGTATKTRTDCLHLDANRADFSATPLSGLTPLGVQFTDLSTGEFDAWSWDFNSDGTVDATDQNPAHTYSAGGPKTVTLTVSSPNGQDDEVKADYIRILQPYYRPAPLMDYVPQEVGIYDTTYENLAEVECRGCHGDSLASRHHHSEQAGNCALCHQPVPVPPENWPPELGWPPQGPWPPWFEDPTGVERNCLAGGCHSWDDVEANGWHHNNGYSAAVNCIACHDRDITEGFRPGVSFTEEPPKVMPPSIHACENCHWDQDVKAAAPGFDPAGSAQSDAGHPSTYEHRDPWGIPQGYFEYGLNVYGNQSTHMKAKTNFASNCSVCHGLDDETTIFDASNPEAIRTCQRCHTKETLHAVHRQESHGWEAVGFHVAENSDGIPDSFRVFTGNQMCIGCHGEVPAIPEIRRLKPRSIRPLMVLKIVGNNFGSSQGDSTIHIGNQIFDNTSSRIKFWSNTKVKLRMPNYKTQWYKGKDSRRKKVRVTVNGIESNEKALKVFKPCDCDLNGDGVCDSVDSELLAAEMNRTDCSEPGFKCKGDLNSDGAVDGSDADLFMDSFERTDCQQL